MKIYFLVISLLISLASFSQIDTAFILQLKALDTANILQFDTLAVPEDSYTKKIRTLRKERSGFDVETVIRIKIMEEQQKDNARPKEFYDRLLNEVTTGPTSKLIDNLLINLYRKSFTEKEIQELIKFYKTSAGKKMNKEFILLILRSTKSVEQLLKIATKKMEL